MGRTATEIVAPEDAPAGPQALARLNASTEGLAELNQEQRAATAALARELNYAGSTDPDVLENSARDAIRRIGAGIFELGGYLLLLKSACEHGKFLPALERLGLETRSAQQYMSVAKRFANTKTSSHLEALGMSKLVDLLPLDDEQLEDLTELGKTGELHLDDVARMSVRELRAAVREERTRNQRQADVNAELSKEINDERVKRGALKVTLRDWPARFKGGLMEQARVAALDAEKAIAALESVRIAALEDKAEYPAEQQSLDSARAALARQMTSDMVRIKHVLDVFESAFDASLGEIADARVL